MKFREATHNGSGGIDCEIEHPHFGWIPFTARQDDPEESGRLVYAATLETAAEYVAPVIDPAEALAAEARFQRNALLAASDWTQVADAPVDQAAWATYRQALRDITEQAGFPESIDWPLSP